MDQFKADLMKRLNDPTVIKKAVDAMKKQAEKPGMDPKLAAAIKKLK